MYKGLVCDFGGVLTEPILDIRHPQDKKADNISKFFFENLRNEYHVLSPSKIDNRSVNSLIQKNCPGIYVTTPITKVSSSCAKLWSPYEVTMVPPDNLLQTMPKVPKVINDSGGKISNAVAQRWGIAFFTDRKWYQWAEAYGQIRFLSKLLNPSIISQSDANVYSSGGTIQDPNCDVFPTSIELMSTTPQAKQYFATMNNLPTNSSYTLIMEYSPPVSGTCIEMVTNDKGITYRYGSGFNASGVLFAPGHYVTNPVLGNFWYQDSYGGCQETNSIANYPISWCQGFNGGS